ncbi:MAG: hypothetical protein ACTHLH_09865 [Solirubrobacterales bacterium]
MMRRRGIWGALPAALAVVLLALPACASATRQAMVVQPDGRIVLAGRVWPEAGALARLNADGSLDQSFGDGGFVVDRRLPGFRALALQPNGDIVGAAVGGFQLARYLPDGTPDPGFAGGGVGGIDEPDQLHFLYEYARYGPTAVLVQPGAGIVVGGNRELSSGGGSEGWVKRYDESGKPAETVGHVPRSGEQAYDVGLSDLLEEPDGSIVGAGWFRPGYPSEPSELLARFVPGSGTEYDPSFGAGAGLVRPTFPTDIFFPSIFNALASDGGDLLAAGSTAGTFLLARFDQAGNLDSGFGQGGFVMPTVQGSVAEREASSWAEDVVALPDHRILLGGGTSQWGVWSHGKSGAFCQQCPQPLLARFDASGHLDPSFGNGGLLRLLKPDGSIFEGAVEQMATLPDGKILVKGYVPSSRVSSAPFVARLNPDGSYDPSFGEGGLTVVELPCTDQPEAQLRQEGCIPSALVKLRLVGQRKGPPALYLRLRPNFSWAALRAFTLTLPKGLRLRRHFKAKLSMAGAGEGAKIELGSPRPGHPQTILFFRELGDVPQVAVRLRRGALRFAGRRRHEKLTLKVGAEFDDTRWGELAGNDVVVRHLRLSAP